MNHYDRALQSFLLWCGDLTPMEKADAITMFDKTMKAAIAKLEDRIDELYEIIVN